MEGFDPLTMQYLATPTSLGGAAPADFLANPLMPLDLHTTPSEYGGDTFAGSDYNAGQMSAHHGHPGKRFSNPFEDHFSEVMSAYDPVNLPDPNAAESPAIDTDNKLLSFSTPIYNYALLDAFSQRIQISISAQLHGMFFLAESPWGPTSDPTGTVMGPPAELTCYRRNLFQISGSITLPRRMRYILTEQGEQIPIVAQELTVSATESVENNAVKVISVPWKTPAANAAATAGAGAGTAAAPAADEKVEKEPPSIPLDTMSAQDMDPEYANFPITWKRLQFRIATANNGRRKELQQHFVVRLKLMCSLSTGQKVSVCEAASNAIIVRGRSPRNFQSRKEFPVGGSGSTSGRKSNHGGSMVRKLSEDQTATQQRLAGVPPAKFPTLSPKHETGHVNFAFDNLDHQLEHGFLDWKAPGVGHDSGALTALPPETFEMPEHGLYAQSSPDLHRTSAAQQSRPPQEPINLSLMDEEPKKLDESSPEGTGRGTGTGAASSSPHKMAKLASRAPSFTLNNLNSPDESADLLYEYFPLGLDDWMPPVDAVYRPHVVHHLTSTTSLDQRIANVKMRSKRYFSEDQPLKSPT